MTSSTCCRKFAHHWACESTVRTCELAVLYGSSVAQKRDTMSIIIAMTGLVLWSALFQQPQYLIVRPPWPPLSTTDGNLFVLVATSNGRSVRHRRWPSGGRAARLRRESVGCPEAGGVFPHTQPTYAALQPPPHPQWTPPSSLCPGSWLFCLPTQLL